MRCQNVGNEMSKSLKVKFKAFNVTLKHFNVINILNINMCYNMKLLTRTRYIYFYAVESIAFHNIYVAVTMKKCVRST